jgi:hypothetical protein
LYLPAFNKDEFVEYYNSNKNKILEDLNEDIDEDFNFDKKLEVLEKDLEKSINEGIANNTNAYRFLRYFFEKMFKKE